MNPKTWYAIDENGSIYECFRTTINPGYISEGVSYHKICYYRTNDMGDLTKCIPEKIYETKEECDTIVKMTIEEIKQAIQNKLKIIVNESAKNNFISVFCVFQNISYCGRSYSKKEAYRKLYEKLGEIICQNQKFQN